jgi:acyl-CoA reductase-like NAD-dependent aldehyde dehydrogenase
MPHETDPAALEEVRAKMEKAYSAWRAYSNFTQEQVDAVVERAAAAGRQHARRLAELAVRETGYGNVEDKTGKNLLSAEWLPKKIQGMRTVGLLREVPGEGIVEYGVPLGVVAAIVPTTNPTSTVIFKALISLKAGNAVVFSPHPHAKGCTCETAELLHRAAVEAGAPEGVIQCLAQPTLESTQALMRHPRTAVILATGGSGMVRAAYSSGKPAFGVGPGNVPVLLDRSADVPEAVAKIVQGKSFDYGTVCSSEQSLVAEESLREPILAALGAARAHLCDERQREALTKLLITPAGTINAKCVGQPAHKIAEMAGFQVPPDTPILAVEIQGVGRAHPLSAEKLSPVLALLFVSDFAAALDACEAVLRFGGLGHSAVIHARDEARIHEYARRMPAMRVMVNTPSPQGSVGITTNLLPSMTLGCGAAGGNSTGDNVGPLHLINIKRLAYAVRRPEDAFQIPAAGPAHATPTEIVDRFLASRQGTRTTAVVAECACDRSLTVAAPKPPPVTASPKIAVAEVVIVDFVCESDVRDALRDSRKIYIGPRSIVTPSARDLADRHDILVLAQR